MAAIYGLPTTQSPIASPDRAHPMRRFSSTTHTPSASPPTAHSSLSRVSPDQGLPPNKRQRLSAATWPTINNDTSAGDNLSPTAMAPPRSAHETSPEGRSAASAISIDDDANADAGNDEPGPSAPGNAGEDQAGNAQKPVVPTPVTTPVMQLPTPDQKRRPIRAPPGVLQLTPRSLQIQKRVLPDRQARRTSQLVISKTLQVEDKDDDAYIRDLERKHPYPPPKASNSETVGKGSQKRKISPLSQEASATDSGENSSDKDSETTTPMQGKPKTNSLVQQAIQNPNPTTKLTDVVEPYILQHGPPTASARTLYELFARICTWSYKEKLTKCAFCEYVL